MDSELNFLIVTGMSGAGKSTAIKFLEDIGFFCVDNLPPELIPKFAEICYKPGSEINKVALGVDVRGGKLFNELSGRLDEMQKLGYSYKVLFLDASDEVLVKRFKETRRNHPLAKLERIEQGIEQERSLLSEIRARAKNMPGGYLIDTSNLLVRQLKEQINELFYLDKGFENLIITILTFGFKYGIPPVSDLVFDVRFIPNPFYLPELKEHTGLEDGVRDYVLQWPQSEVFLTKTGDMLEYLIPHYIQEGKNQLVVSVGCTGGRHRSVTLATKLYESLIENGHSVVIQHRDIEKDRQR